jgi:hypothetical protein
MGFGPLTSLKGPRPVIGRAGSMTEPYTGGARPR